MTPTVFTAAWDAGGQPMIDGKMEAAEGFKRASAPFRDFMLCAHLYADDLKLFVDLSKTEVAEEKRYAASGRHPRLHDLLKLKTRL